MSTYKTGITQWFLDSPPSPESLKLVHALHFDSLHINAGLPSQQEYMGNPKTEQAYLQALDKFPVAITAVSVNLIEEEGLLVSPSMEISGYLQEVIETVIQVAERMQVKWVYFPSFGLSRIQNRSDFDKTAKILQYACDVADKMKVQIATENTLSASENRILIEQVNRRNLKILLDTFNPVLAGHSVIELIDNLFPFLADEVHVKDGANQTMGNIRLGLGEGNLLQTLACLHEKGFNGTYILENNYLQNGYDLIEEDLRLLTSLISEASSERQL